MTRSFYSFAVFFTGLYIVIAFFWGIIYFQLGARVYELQSITGWFVYFFLISLIWSLILLKYYHYKQYGFTFWTMAVSIAASLYQFILFYNLLTITRELTAHYIVATFVVSGTGILYTISLIFSEAGKRPWLKAAGFFSCLLGLAGLSALIWALNSIDIRQNGTMLRIEQWGSLIGSLIPVLYIMNFWSERVPAKKTYTSHQESLDVLMGVVALTGLAFTLIFASKLSGESMWLANHPDHVGEYVEKLAQPFDAGTYVNSDGDSIQYRLLKPLDYDSAKQYPLVVCLHGSSGCGTDNVKQVAASLPAQWLSTHENRMKYPAFLFVPQCPPEMGWGGMPHVPAVDSLVFDSILALEKELPIDADRCYVAGNSLGGYGTWHLICTRPQLFAAAIPISGGGNPALAQNMVEVRVWAFHGAQDINVPVSGSRDMIEAIKKAGGNPRYKEYPDEAHDIGNDVKATPGLLDWLFAQKRD